MRKLCISAEVNFINRMLRTTMTRPIFREIAENSHPRSIHCASPALGTVPNNLKGKSKGSQEWLIRQLNDPYVKKAKALNYRARSAFKLIEIDDRFKVLKPGLRVVECGAAPGAWTQVVVQRINSDGKDPEQRVGKVVAVDLLDIEPIPGAILLPNSDFTSPDTQVRIQELIGSRDPGIIKGSEAEAENSLKRPFNLILSDMAPNASGMGSLDHSKIMSLARSSLRFAIENGRPGSHFVTKVWDGAELKNLERMLKELYKTVTRVKPKSSREESAETFIVAQYKFKY